MRAVLLAVVVAGCADGDEPITLENANEMVECRDGRWKDSNGAEITACARACVDVPLASPIVTCAAGVAGPEKYVEGTRGLCGPISSSPTRVEWFRCL